ncbi:MAG: chemotaxis protein CheA [Pseudomonadota bacterium]
MDELLEQFLLEGRDLVAQASDDFAALRRRPDDAGAVDSAFRAMHTLKGSVAIFAMMPAERALHAAETLLETARTRGGAIGIEALDGLVACLDQVDRWIDDMEAFGALPQDAAPIADRLVSRLAGHTPGPETADAAAMSDGAIWADLIAERHPSIVAAADTVLTAFRYSPSADCFFQGEDPLAIAMAVPELLSLDVLPAGGEWPARGDIEPFACISVLEGISAAGPDKVRSSFRLVPDRVEVTTIGAGDAAARSSTGTRDSKGGDILRVPSARIDAMADGLGELIVAVNAVAGLTRDAARIDRSLAASVQAVQAKLEQVTGRLHGELSAVRAVTLENMVRRLPRLVREIADGLGKKVSFNVQGDELEVDKQIADGLFEPLLHLLRNAIDHGAEPSDSRTAAGKTADCTITLRFLRSGDSIEVVLSDDGAGIDPRRIREAAVDRALLPRADVDVLSDAEALRLIFSPGFSTAHTVTSVSGRGVGMDAVKAAIERLRGTLAVESAVGEGTTFRIRLQAGALTTPLLLVHVGAERYGVALDQIVETARLGEGALQAVGGGRACVLRGRTVPVVSLGALLNTGEPDDPLARVLITQAGGDRVAVRVDRFGERFNAFVRPPVGMLAAVPGVTGSALMGDGSVLLVLDLPELLA